MQPPINIERRNGSELLTIGVSEVPAEAIRVNNTLPTVNPDTTCIVTIPVYKEFMSGRITQTLEELHRQTVTQSKFEVLLVVNNPRPGFDPYGKGGFDENMALIEYVNEAKSYGKFSNIHIVDATDGRLPKRHLGIVRGLGNEVAALRLKDSEMGLRGVIVQLDADCSIDPYFLEEMIQAYSSNPDIESATVALLPLPLDYESDDYYLSLAEIFRRQVQAKKGTGIPSSPGPAISFRAFLQYNPKFREYMNVFMNEDLRQGQAMHEISHHRILIYPRVYAGDRKRIEGFDAAMRPLLGLNSVPLSSFESLIEIITQNRLHLQEGTPNNLTSVIQSTLEASSPDLGNEFRDAYEREISLVQKRLDIDPNTNSRVLMGACLFALSRMVLLRFDE